jgi:putative membrane protein
LAANQGLYNRLLTAGLIWTFFIPNEIWKTNISFFFLGCVAIAGLYGLHTAAKRMFLVQALPALITISLHLVQQ